MKGFLCEVLILAGAYLLVHNPVVGGILIAVGVVFGTIRYLIEFSRWKVQGDLLSDLHIFLTSISKAASSLGIEKIHVKHNETVH